VSVLRLFALLNNTSTMHGDPAGQSSFQGNYCSVSTQMTASVDLACK